MNPRKLGTELSVFPVGLGCMGMSFAYGGQAEKDAIATLQPRRRHRRDLVRHGRSLRPLRERGAARQGAEGRARPRRHRHQIRLQDLGRRPGRGAHGRRRQPPRARQGRRRGLAQAARHRRDRPLLPAPRRSQRADRGYGRRDGRAGARGQGARARAFRGECRHHPPRPRRASDRGRAERIFAVEPRARSGSAAGLPRARHRLRAVQPARPRPADRHHPHAGDARRRRLAQDLAALPGRQHGGQCGGSSTRWPRSPRQRASRSAQLALAWVLHQGDFIVPIPGARKMRHLEDNTAAAQIMLDAGELAAIGEALSPAKVAGKRYTDAALALVDG